MENNQNANSTVVKPKTNKNAISSIAFSAISIFIFWWLSIAGIITGIMALRELKTSNENGKGLAIAGIVIGVIGEALYWYFQFAS